MPMTFGQPDEIARQFDVMQASSPKVGLVYCWSIDIDENNFIILPVKPKFAAQGRVIEQLATGNFLGYDTKLPFPGTLDWKLYLAVSEICEFAVVPDHLVGYRQSIGSTSRDLLAMVQSMQLVARWLEEKWPDLSEHLSDLRTQFSNAYFARLAIENNQIPCSLAVSCESLRGPSSGIVRTIVQFGARLLAQMAGMRWAAIRQQGWGAFRFWFHSGNCRLLEDFTEIPALLDGRLSTSKDLTDEGVQFEE
jgi:hypothetical protein